VPKLTVTVITRNEAANIAAALASVAWADEMIVVDADSSDGTAAIATAAGARVEVRPWPGYSDQKNFAASIAANDWILSLDADERVTPELAAEIRTLLADAPPRHGYRVPRISFYLGRWIRGTDWYPDYQLRLYDRRAGRWNGRVVHESVALDGEPGALKHDLQHYPSLAGVALHPPFAFFRNYILRGGFRLGGTGLIVSGLNSYYVFLKLAKTRELR
jgi:glycosyltransferase involved in cell wall biosynthesis